MAWSQILNLAALPGPDAKRLAGHVVQLLHKRIVHLHAHAAHDERLAPSRAPELPLQETWIFPPTKTATPKPVMLIMREPQPPRNR